VTARNVGGQRRKDSPLVANPPLSSTSALTQFTNYPAAVMSMSCDRNTATHKLEIDKSQPGIYGR
jgi:hypothetical protein